MKERPIIFSGLMVRAILEGRKTQTRRVAKLTDSGRVKAVGSARNWHLDDPNAALACPHGQPGDRLWAKETWMDADIPKAMVGADQVIRGPQSERVATGNWIRAAWHKDAPDPMGWPIRRGWRSPICMPRWASRITLELVNVRVERVQDISPRDAIAEGIPVEKGVGMIEGEDCYMMTTNSGYMRGPRGAIMAYQDLWISIHGKESWAANPWVWALEFKRVTQ